MSVVIRPSQDEFKGIICTKELAAEDTFLQGGYAECIFFKWLFGNISSKREWFEYF